MLIGFESGLLLTLLAPMFLGAASFLLTARALKFLAPVFVFSAAFGSIEVAVNVFRDGVRRYSFGGWGAPLGIDAHVDGAGAVMILLTSAVCGSVFGYASGYFARAETQEWDEGHGLWPLLFLLWGSLNMIFTVADLFTIYVCLEAITLAAVASITLAGTIESHKAALRYLMTALTGSLAYLLGVALVYGRMNTLDWTLLAGRVGEGDGVEWMALSLMTAGLAIKSALFPVHFWLPGAHSNAPAPVSALLSALVIKASFFVLLRLWLQVFSGSAGWMAAHFIGVLGAGAILWGSFQAIVQERLKLMVAYSTVAQVGYLFLAFPLLMEAARTGDETARSDAWSGVIYLVLSHAIAKAALFLVAGIFLRVSKSDRLRDLKGVAADFPIPTLVWGLAGISLIGLPPSGGFIAKWLLLLSAIRFGQWAYGGIIIIGGLLASIYVFRVLWFAFLSEENPLRESKTPIIMPLASLFLGILIVLMGMRTTELLALIRIGSPLLAGKAMHP